MIRQTIFWIHFSCAAVVGVVVLMMSVTGALLTYERQILDWELRTRYENTDTGNDRLSFGQLAAAVENEGGFAPRILTIHHDPAVPVLAREGRAHKRYVDPYSGFVIPQHRSTLEAFFATITRWHRWFDVDGEQRDAARLVTGLSNLVFLVMILTGAYLWLPKVFKYRPLRNRFWFTRNRNSAARDFNWHHVLGFWSMIPLLVIVLSATVFSFDWANDLVYRLAGEEPPRHGRPQAPDHQGQNDPSTKQEQHRRADALDAMVDRAAATYDDWRTITIHLPRTSAAETIEIEIDRGTGGQPHKRHTLVFDRESAQLRDSIPFSARSPGRQIRSWLRFLHTGEALGIMGQTIAGLASLATVVMIWTGLALGYRRMRRMWTSHRARTSVA